MSMNQIDILLATYNGEAYLSEQIDSIINQSYDNWIMLIRDDGSKDGTLDIIEWYTKKYYNKIFLIKDGKKNLGVCGNFSALLNNSRSDYVMFCDQDDVWIKDKIKITFQKMKEMENTNSPHCPILVHTDLIVVDRNLEKISSSFWKFSHLNPVVQKTFSRLLIQNFVTGCTMMINRSLKNLSPVIPVSAMCHDWWLALVACAFGKIESLPTPMVLYRQHQSNEIGATSWNHFLFLINAINLLVHKNFYATFKEEKNQIRNVLKKIINQSKSFYAYYYEKLNKQQLRPLTFFNNIETHNFIDRRIKLLKNRIYANGFARNLKLLIFV